MSAARHAPESMFPSIEQMDFIADGLAGKGNGLERMRVARRLHERGRPAGSRNRRTEKFASYFIGKFGDPLDVFGEIMSMPVDALMQMMIDLQGGDAKHKPIRAIDVLRLKLEAADKAAPYVRGKQPISIEVAGRKDAIILMAGNNVDLGEVSAQDARDLIEEFGLAAFSGEMKLLPRDKIIDAEYADIDPVDDEDGGGIS